MLTSLGDTPRDSNSDRYPLSASNTPSQPNPSSLAVLPTLHGDVQQSPSKSEHRLVQAEPLLEMNLHMKVG